MATKKGTAKETMQVNAVISAKANEQPQAILGELLLKALGESAAAVVPKVAEKVADTLTSKQPLETAILDSTIDNGWCRVTVEVKNLSTNGLYLESMKLTMPKAKHEYMATERSMNGFDVPREQLERTLPKLVSPSSYYKFTFAFRLDAHPEVNNFQFGIADLKYSLLNETKSAVTEFQFRIRVA